MSNNQKPILIKDLGMLYPKPDSKRKQRYGLYVCGYCGKTFKVITASIKTGNTHSCGCQKHLFKETHGKHGTKLYQVWGGMIQRCRNPKSKFYKNYGGRGIVVCDRWNSFENFHEDMHIGYKQGLTIERINNDGKYEPSNCIWATRLEQNHNQRLLNSTNKSGYAGVFWDKERGKWQSKVKYNYKDKYIGRFNTALEAAKARDKYIIDNGFTLPLNGVI